MEIFKKVSNFDFMGLRKFTFISSLVLLLVIAGSLATRGLNFGVDFTGGTIIELGYQQPVVLEEVRQRLGQAGFHGVVVQHFGSSRDVLIRLAPSTGQTQAEVSTRVLESLKQSGQNSIELRRIEFVGPQVGDELVEQGGLALLLAFIGVFIYVMLRFEWRFAVGAVAATAHDIIVTIGIFSIFQIEFDLTVLAAVLAVLGYSLNDTVVVFDRIRENFRKMRKGTTIEIMNVSINQTLSRTIMTSVTTLMVVTVLFFFGGETVRGLSLAMIIGVVFGTYSSIFFASPIVLMLGVDRANLIPVPVKKEGEGADLRP